MSKSKSVPKFKDYLGRPFRIAYEEELDRIKAVQQSIKHPHFYYAIYDMKTGEVQYKRKKWYQWFSGKRIVHIKVAPMITEGLSDYENTSI